MGLKRDDVARQQIITLAPVILLQSPIGLIREWHIEFSHIPAIPPYVIPGAVQMRTLDLGGRLLYTQRPLCAAVREGRTSE